jgi:hypothetical protein
MIDWFNDIWNSMPPWLWPKMMNIVGLIIIFISLNYAAISSRNKRNK